MRKLLFLILVLSTPFLNSLNISDLEDEELKEIIKSVAFSYTKDIEVLNSTSDCFAEFISRNSYKLYRTEILDLIELLSNTYKLCFLGENYYIEKNGFSPKTFGLNSSSSRIHIYPESIKTTINEWLKSEMIISIENYIKTNLSKKERLNLLSNRVTYLSPSKLYKNHLVTFEGPYVKIGGEFSGDGEYIFVLDIKGKHLFAGKKLPPTENQKKFGHGSFLAGNPVQCAGKVTLKSGKIAFFYLHSGHYRPKHLHGENLREYLIKAGYPDAYHVPIRSHRRS